MYCCFEDIFDWVDSVDVMSVIVIVLGYVDGDV